VAGISSKAVAFGGTDEYVTIGDVLAFERTQAFSFSAWIKYSGSNYAMVFAKVASPNWTGYQFWGNTTGKLGFYLCNTDTTNYLYVLSTSTTLNDGAWHHIVATYDGTSLAAGVLLYVDGASVAFTTVGNNLTASTVSTTPLTIGSDRSTNYSVGSLDEVAVYNKALSGAEVTWIYNSGAPRGLTDSGCPSDLAAWWRMGEGDTFPTLLDSGPGGLGTINPYPTLQDFSGNGHDGTMNNMTSGSIVADVPSGGYTTKSVQFVGSSLSTVTMGDTLGFDRDLPFSVSFWARTVAGAGGGFVRKSASGSGSGWFIYTFGNDLRVFMWNGGNYFYRVTDAVLTASWKHFCVTWDGSNTDAGLQCYVNASVPTFVTTQGTPVSSSWANSGSLTLGLGWSDTYWTGFMDEVAIYSKQLSPTEVAWIYNSGSPQALDAGGAPSLLAGWWKMGEAPSGLVPFNGTMTNMESTDIYDLYSNGQILPTPILISEATGGGRGPEATVISGGSGPGPVTVQHYKLRARDNGLGPPAAYTEWESTSYTSNPTATPVGAWVEKTILAHWTT
jgi:hypothetical protein